MRMLILFLLPVLGFAQPDPNENELIREVLALDENQSDDGAGFENLGNYLSQPVNINKATEDELTLLSLLSKEQIRALIRHREEHGKLISIYELQAIDGFDPLTIHRLLPFIEIRDPAERIDRDLVRRIRREGDSYFLLLAAMPLERKQGFNHASDQHFAGSRPRIVARYRNSRPGDYSFGFTAEKDEGEKIAMRPGEKQIGFDHLSIHLQLMNKGRVKNFVAGDFQCQFGQGLVWGGAIGFGKGGETINTTRKGNFGLVPYTSAYEAGYFRGAAATIKITRYFACHAIFSRAFRDGNVKEIQDELSASGIQSTGLHRTHAEWQGRKSILETISGGVLQYSRRNIESGLSFQRVSYSVPLNRSPQPYNQFMFSGNMNNNVGAFLNFNLHNFSFFSEMASSIGSGKAYLMGSAISLGKKLEVSLVHRNYGRNYYSFYSNAFSENTLAQNERGLYWGWKYKFNRRYLASGYIDFFQFPWLRFRAYAPSKGIEYLLRMTYQFSRNTQLSVQWRREVKSRNTPEENVRYILGDASKTNTCINLDYAINPSLSMKSRVQTSQFNFGGETSHGFLFLHDISFAWRKLKLTGRYALFDTDNFDNRLYAYEHDVWMSYSLPAYYGKGVRKYIVAQYTFNKFLTIWLKYSHTRYTDRSSIGSGLEMIEGNMKNEVKLETRIKF